MTSTVEKLVYLALILLVPFPCKAVDSPEETRLPMENEMYIAPNGVMMPLGTILLVRRESNYCAIRFLEYCPVKGEKVRDCARYEAFWQVDNSGDLRKSNVKSNRGDLVIYKPIGSLFGHPIAFGNVDEIDCGFTKLWWTGMGMTYFFEGDKPQGDYGIELGATKWNSVSEVDVFDPRVKWFRFDENRKRVFVPVESLW